MVASQQAIKKGNKGIKMTKTPEEKAVAIAEFLGIDLDMCCPAQCWFHEDAWRSLDQFIVWLSSPEGEVAMMDKLALWCDKKPKEREFEIGYLSFSMLFDCPCWMVWIGEELGVSEPIAHQANKDRNAALQAAILQMLGKGE